MDPAKQPTNTFVPEIIIYRYKPLYIRHLSEKDNKIGSKVVRYRKLSFD